MDLNDLRKKFHELDSNFSSYFHEKDSTGKKELLKLETILTIFCLMIITLLIAGSTFPNHEKIEGEIVPEIPEKGVKLVLNTETIKLDENRTKQNQKHSYNCAC